MRTIAEENVEKPAKNLAAAAALLAVFTFLAAPASAQQEEGLRLRVHGARFQPASDTFDDETGFGLGLEYRWSRRLGVELSVFRGDLGRELEVEVEPAFEVTAAAGLELTPVLAQLDLHLTPDHRADVYLGPVAGWGLYGDLEVELRGEAGEIFPAARLGAEDAFVWGAHAGVDLPLGGRGFFLSAGATYLRAEVEVEADPESDETQSFDLDPLVFRFGVGLRL